MLNIAIPVIEKLANGDSYQMHPVILRQINRRRAIAESVEEYFSAVKQERSNIKLKNRYYSAITELLEQEDYERILLYFPLSDLKDAPQDFKDTYARAWYNLLNRYDARENFFEGDVFELDARPNDEIERVVKCAHLIPWLLEMEYINFSDIERVLNLGKNDDVLLRSCAETWPVLADRELVTETQLRVLRKLTANLSPRKRLEPLYVSKKRREWLAAKERKSSPLTTPTANLAGPFSRNLSAFRRDLEKIQSGLEPDEIVLIAGSRLKGYGTEDSDWDIFKLKALESDETMCPGSPRAAALYLNAFWLGGDKVQNLDKIAMSKAHEYFRGEDHKMSVERLEQDLLQYRLLHKGYKLFYSGYDSMAKSYPEIDGDCPFYDDGYRRIATELYAKYVFIPQEI